MEGYKGRGKSDPNTAPKGGTGVRRKRKKNAGRLGLVAAMRRALEIVS